jgi:hypothetical protein
VQRMVINGRYITTAEQLFYVPILKCFFGLLTGFAYLPFNLIAQIATQLSYVVAAVLFIMPRQNVRGCITGCVSNVR